MKPNDVIVSKLRKELNDNIVLEDNELYIKSNMKYSMLLYLCKYDKKYEEYLINKLGITRKDLGELIEKRFRK